MNTDAHTDAHTYPNQECGEYDFYEEEEIWEENAEYEDYFAFFGDAYTEESDFFQWEKVNILSSCCRCEFDHVLILSLWPRYGQVVLTLQLSWFPCWVVESIWFAHHSQEICLHVE